MKFLNVWRRGDLVFWKVGSGPRGWLTLNGQNGVTLDPFMWLAFVSYIMRWWLLWLALSSPDSVAFARFPANRPHRALCFPHAPACARVATAVPCVDSLAYQHYS